MWPFLFYWFCFTRVLIWLVLILTSTIFSRCADFAWSFVMSKASEHKLKAFFISITETMIFTLLINFSSWFLIDSLWCLVDCHSLKNWLLNCSFLVLFLQDKFSYSQFAIFDAICLLNLTKCQHFGHWWLKFPVPNYSCIKMHDNVCAWLPVRFLKRTLWRTDEKKQWVYPLARIVEIWGCVASTCIQLIEYKCLFYNV